MRFTQSLLAVLSAAAAQAVIITNADFSSISVGTPFVITYSQAVGPVTVYLGTGDPANVIQGAAVGSSSGATGSISWTPTSGGSYALKIVDAGAPNSPTNPNFSGFFNVAGPVVSTTPSSTSMMASSTSAMSTSSMTSMATPMTTTSFFNGTVTTMTTSSSTQNGTTSSSSMFTPSSSQTSPTNVPTQVPNSMAAGIASPLALVMVAVGALLTLN